MHAPPNTPRACPVCGHRIKATYDACPACGDALQSAGDTLGGWSEWARRRDSLKTLWVVAVIAFWITVAILVVVIFLNDKVDLILVSVALGTMILGVGLKARYQMHLRKEPDKRPIDGKDNHSGL